MVRLLCHDKNPRPPSQILPRLRIGKRHSQDFVVGVRLERFDASVGVPPMGSLSCLDERLFDSSVAVASIQLAFR